MDNETVDDPGNKGQGGLGLTDIVFLILGAVAAMSAFASMMSITYNKNNIRVIPQERDEVFIVSP